MFLKYFFGFTIFLSSYLLFQVQLIIGKHILPWFGGVSSVWTTCMLFFQAGLLLGYGWAHTLTLKTKIKNQGLLQGMILFASVLLITVQYIIWQVPILPVNHYSKGVIFFPAFRIFIILLISIGLPYFVLAATSTLLQSWYFSIQNRSPYWLYAVSNAGSLIGLICYPFIIERFTSIDTQAEIWFILFICYFIVQLSIIVSVSKKSMSTKGMHETNTDHARKSENTSTILFKDYLIWILLAATASTSLLAFTNQVTQEIAVIPFLWVMPLSIYLITFIITFSSRGIYKREIFGVLLGIFSLFIVFTLIRVKTVPVMVQIILFTCSLFVVCMICHGEIARRKPKPEHLTNYYLSIAFGGVLGGIIVTLIAPAIFNGYWELHLSLLACAVLFTYLIKEDRDKRAHVKYLSLMYYLLPGFLAVILFLHPVHYYKDSIFSQRNFYGVVRVEKRRVNNPPSAVRFLLHGITTHGFQFTEKEYQKIPTCYYGKQSGAGLALEKHPVKLVGKNITVGAIGLGIGTVAAYGQEGDTFDFFEINPLINKLAEGEKGFFSYLKDTKGEYRIITGDGRLSMEQMKNGEISLKEKYDVLILDAFSSDSVPTHLLTEEAFALYLEVLKRDGIMAFHTSNRTLSVAWIVIQQAINVNLPSAVIITSGDKYTFDSEWVLVTRNEEFLSLSEVSENIVPYDIFSQQYDLHLWTDRYSNLFEILK